MPDCSPAEENGADERARAGLRETRFRLKVGAGIAGVSAASAWIRALGARFGFPPPDVYRLDLCVSELVTNAAEHGYVGRDPGEVEAEATLGAGGASLVVTITDDGDAFDPLAAPPPARPSDPAQIEVGGLGIHLVRAYADECRYDRRDDRNVFVFVVSRTARDSGESGGGPVHRGVDRRRDRQPVAFPLKRCDGVDVTTDERRGNDRRLLGFISGCELFRGVPYSLIDDVIALCPVREFHEGTVLLRPGERNHHVALVVKGAISVQLGSDEAADFMEIGVGDCAGEMSVIDGKPVSALVTASAGCRLLLIDGTTFVTRILPIPEVARNLVTLLAERMRRSNERVIERLKASIELTGLQRELEFAHQVQTSMVPERSTLAPARPEVQCTAYMRPARQVGGDFYDAFYIERDRLAVMVGDVCGKGMPAALFMSRAMTLLRSEAMTPGSRAQRQHTADLVERANRQLCRGNDARYFASVFVAILDVSTGMLTWVNAGHPPPLIARGSGELRLATGPRAPLIGVIEEARYGVGETALPPGSTLLVYSDGVTEAENPAGELYGETRLIDFVSPLRGLDVEEIVGTITATVDRFTGDHPRSDDVTLLALRYNGAP